MRRLLWGGGRGWRSLRRELRRGKRIRELKRKGQRSERENRRAAPFGRSFEPKRGRERFGMNVTGGRSLQTGENKGDYIEIAKKNASEGRSVSSV